MNKIPGLENIPFGEAIGWTLIHSLWQIALIALLIRVCLFFIPQKKANLRYFALLSGMVLISTWAIFTFYSELELLPNSIDVSEQRQMAFDQQKEEGLNPEQAAPPLVLDRETVSIPSQTYDFIYEVLAPYASRLAIFWYLGVAFFSLSLIIGFLRLNFLKRKSDPVISQKWNSLFSALKNKMRISRSIRLGISEQIAEPMTFYFLRPVILIPVGMLSGLNPAQVEVILLHELAHIKRYDYLVNVFQSILEIIFFYHPVMWWLSAKIREEREHCCDDLVLRFQNNPLVYAEALTQLQKIDEPLKLKLTMSLTGKKNSFSKRIYRLFGKYDQQPSFIKAGTLCLLLILALVSQGFIQSQNKFDLKKELKSLWQAPAKSLDPKISESRSSDQEPDSSIVISNLEADPTSTREITSMTSLDDCSKLLKAILDGNIDLVKSLLAKVDPNCISEQVFQEQIRKGELIYIRTLPRTPLVTAAFAGHLEICKLLIASGAKVDFQSKGDASALMEAAGQGHLEVLKFLESKGGDIHKTINGEGTPLLMAARNGQLEVVKYLSGKGVDLNQTVRGEGTPLLVAARNGQLETLKYLIAKGAKVDQEVMGEGSPILVAARNGHKEVVEYLHKKGADINANTKGEGTPLLVAARNGQLETVKLILNSGGKINQVIHGEGSPLLVAAQNGQLETVKLLLMKGADIDQEIPGEGTPLIAATRNGQLETAQYLISKGANVNKQTSGEGSPMLVAAQNGQLETASLLVSQGADINQEVRGEGTPLLVAARNGQLETVKLLLNKGADINQEVRGEGTPLLVAARDGQLETVKLLLNKGANIDQKVSGEGSPLMVAAQNGQLETVKLLLFKGAAIDAQLRGEGNALFVAARNGQVEIVKYLLSKGAQVDAIIPGEGTALLVAVRNHNDQMAKLLLENGADPYLSVPGEGYAMYYARMAKNQKMIDLLNKYEK